jgi:hypothetical protein
MKSGLGLACLAFWLTGAALGGVTVYEDNFNDGIRNKALWEVDNYFHGKFVETDGRLYGYSGVLNPLDDYHGITWLQKPAISLIDGDTLEMEVLCRLPMLPLGSATDAHIGMQFGFTIPNSSPKLSVFLWFMINQTGRHLTLDVYRPDMTSIGYGIIPPGNLSKYYFKLRFKTSSGAFTVWCRTRSDQPWTELKKISLSTEWEEPPGSSATLQPFVQFSTKKTRVEDPNCVYYDNFKVTRTRP